MYSSNKQEMFEDQKGRSHKTAIDLIALFFLFIFSCLIFALAMPHGAGKTQDYIVPALIIIGCFNALLYNASTKASIIFINTLISVYAGMSLISFLFGQGEIISITFAVLSAGTIVFHFKRRKNIAAETRKISETRSVG